jgi:NitT/TauT family transport system substrate-binding protein
MKALSRHFILAALSGFAATGAMAKDKIAIGTSWTAQAEQGGYYQALAEGIYDHYDLDVTIRQGGAQVNTPQLLASGVIDFASVSSSSAPLNMITEGIPVVAVGAGFQKSPQILMAHPEMGFKSVADIKGHPVFISADGRESFWKFLNIKYGFTDDQIRPYTFNIAPFVVDKSAVQQGFVTNEPFRAKEAGVTPAVFLLADAGYPSYSDVIVTTRKMTDQNPDVVRRFVAATMEGWKGFLHSDNTKAVALIRAAAPDYGLNDARDTVSVLKETGLVESGDALTRGIGTMTDERWKTFFETMVQAGVFKPTLDYKSAYTLRFLPNAPH